MRNLRLLVLVLPALLLPIVACEDSSSSSGGSFAPEAGGGFEASMPEAGPLPDGGADVVAPPPPPKGVTVTVAVGAAPQANVRVLAHDVAGAVTGDVKTNAGGKATFATPPSMITVLADGGASLPGRVTPVTYMGVGDGDNLVVSIPAAPIVSTGPYASYTVSFAASSLIKGASSFSVYAGGTPNSNTNCFGSSGAQGTPASVDLYPECLAPTGNTVIATAADVNGVVGHGFQKGNTKPGAGLAQPVGPLAFVAPGKTKITASNLPSAGTPFHFARLFAVTGTSIFSVDNATGSLDTGDLTYLTATNFAEAYQTVVASDTNALGRQSEQAFVRREATTAPALVTLANFDFVNALPPITDVVIATPTPTRPDVTFVSGGALTGSDAGFVILNWSVSADETSGSWLFLVPPTTTGFKVPALPADAAAFVPAANVAVAGTIFFDATQLAGYKDVKALPISTSNGIDFLDYNRPIPTPGTLRVTRLSFGQRG